MKRSEVGLLLFAVLAAASAALLVVLAGAWLSRSVGFNVGANVIQWTSGPGTFAVVVGALWMRWHRRCATRWCVRLGEHPVAGTLRRVCHDHHTREHHELVHARDGAEHRASGRLGWGESHDKEG